MRWVCGGGGGLLIGLCLWSMFVVVVGCPKPLLWAVVVGCGGGVGFFLLVVPGFFCCWICGFVEFWLFLCVILVGFLDDFVANLMHLGCVNGSLWIVEVVVGCGWQ